MAATISAYGAGALATGSVTIPFPATVAGDRVFALIAGVGTTVTTVPTGWTLKSGVNASTARRLELFYMNAAADGTEGGTSQAFTRTGGDACTAVMIAVSGAASSGDPFEALATQTGVQSAGSDATLPGITTLTANALILAVAAHGTGNTSGGGSVSGTDPTFVDDKDVVAHVPILTRDRLTFNNASATTNTVTWPAWGAGTTRDTGAVAIAHVTVKSGTATVTGTGWTQLVAPQGDAASPTGRLHTLYHVIDVADVNAGGASGTLPTLTISGTAVKVAAVCQIWWGADPTSPNQSGSGQVNASSTSSSAPTRTGTQTHNAAVYATGPSLGVTLSTAPSTFTLPTSGTIAATGGSSATQCGVGIAYKLLVSTTATGVLTGTLSGAAPSAGVSYILNALGSSSTATNGQHLAIYSGTKTAAGAIAAGRTETQPFAYNTNWQTILLAVKPGGGVTVTGTATFATGGGAIAASGTVQTQVTATSTFATGGGAIASSGTVQTQVTGTAAFTSGGAAIASAGSLRVNGTATLAALNISLAATGALTDTGTATFTTSGAAIAAQAALALTGTAALTTGGGALAATGTVSAAGVTGLSTLATGGAAVASSGTVQTQVTGTSAIATGGLAIASVGTLTDTGTATLTTGGAAIAAAGALSLAGTATLATGGGAIAASGTVQTQITATAALTTGGAALAGSGALTLTGTASLTTAGAALAATGSLTDTGTVTLTTGGAAVAATGTVRTQVTGTSSLATGGAALAGTATVQAAQVTGTGAFTAGGTSLAATATVRTQVTGTADLKAGPPSLTATATASVTASGAMTVGAPSLAATGSVAAGSVSSTGTFAAGPPSLAASGTVQSLVTATGSFTGAAPALAAIGSVTGQVLGTASFATGGASLTSSGAVSEPEVPEESTNLVPSRQVHTNEYSSPPRHARQRSPRVTPARPLPNDY